MKLNEALKILKTKYNVKQQASDVFMLDLQKLLNSYTYCYIVLKEINGEAYLTDYSTTSELVDTEEEEYCEICKKNGVNFNKFNIECKFQSNEDVNKMLKCIDDIMASDK